MHVPQKVTETIRHRITIFYSSNNIALLGGWTGNYYDLSTGLGRKTGTDGFHFNLQQAL